MEVKAGVAGVDIIVFRKQNQGAFGSDQEGDLFDTIVTKYEVRHSPRRSRFVFFAQV